MYKPTFNSRRVLVFRQFQNKSYSLFACLGREVVCSVLSVATLTYASAGTVATRPVVSDSTATTTAREMLLDEVAVTGSRAPLTKSQAARMVTVLERSDIQQAPVQSVNDLLKYAVGVDVRQRGPLGSQTDISIRGGTQEQIIVLLNGVNICDPQTGHNTVDLPCDLADIVRIEVIEGPAGRIYGTSSLVGAINIVTTALPYGQSHDCRLYARAEGGSYGYANATIRYSTTSLLHCSSRSDDYQSKSSSALHLPNSLNMSLSANYSRSDGWSRSQKGNLNNDHRGEKLFLQGGYDDEQVSLKWHAGVTNKGWGSSTFYATPRWPADNQYEHTTKIITAISAKTKNGALRLMPSLYWNRNYDRYEGYRGQPAKMGFNYNRTDVCGAGVNAYFDTPLGRTAFGGELRNEDLISGNLGEPLSQTHPISGTDREYTLGLNRTNISAYLEHNILLDHLTISAGLVAVKNTWSNMPITVYPGADVSWRPNGHWRLHAAVNTSLRMPSFTEMYYKLQGYSADPHLRPEETTAIETSATYSLRTAEQGLSPLSTTVTAWHHRGRNMIDWIMDTSLGDDATWQSVNHTRINSTGLEAALTLRPGAWQRQLAWIKRVVVSYNYITQDKEEEAGIVSQYALEYLRHKLVGKAGIGLSQQLTLAVVGRWQDRIGSYTDFEGNTHNYAPYFIVDARLAWQRDYLTLYAEANNLLGTSYVDYGHVPQPGCWLTAGISVAL